MGTRVDGWRREVKNHKSNARPESNRDPEIGVVSTTELSTRGRFANKRGESRASVEASASTGDEVSEQAPSAKHRGRPKRPFRYLKFEWIGFKGVACHANRLDQDQQHAA